MPDNPPEAPVAQQIPENKSGNPEMTSQLVAQMLSITTGRQYTPTEGQVDKLLALQEKGMDYTHVERTSFLPKDILQHLAYLFVILIIAGIFIFSAFFAKEYLDIIGSIILGLAAGGFGGYGIGSSKAKKNNDE